MDRVNFKISCATPNEICPYRLKQGTENPICQENEWTCPNLVIENIPCVQKEGALEACQRDEQLTDKELEENRQAWAKLSSNADKVTSNGCVDRDGGKK